MKKLLALTLAVLIVLSLSSVAFAYNAFDPQYMGNDLEFDLNSFLSVGNAQRGWKAGDTFLGTSARIEDYTIKNELTSPKKSAIESIKFNDDGDKVVVKLVANYAGGSKTLAGTIKLVAKSTVTSGVRDTFVLNVSSGMSYGYSVLKIGKSAFIDDDLVFNYTEYKGEDGYINSGIPYAPGNTPSNNGEDFIVDFGSKNGTAKISWGNIDSYSGYTDDPAFYFEVKVNEQGKLFLGYDNKANKAITNKYDSADLTFYNFLAAPSFDFTGTAKVFSDNEKLYIYQVVDGGLKKIDAKYDADEESYAWKTKTLGSYVTSDVELATVIDGVVNPETGANDFVNVAVVLAVVSLAAAGAVVLKK